MKKYRYMFFLIITAAIFLSGMWIGEQVASVQTDNIFRLQEDLQVNAAAINLQSELIGENICQMDVYEITKDRFEFGRRLANLEALKGYADEDVILMKNRYSIYSIQQYLLLSQQRKDCEIDIEPILFFYDNRRSKDDSVVQGYVLDYVYRTAPEKVATFSFSINVHNAAVDTLLDKYNIVRGPTLVIGEQKYERIYEADELFELIGIK